MIERRTFLQLSALPLLPRKPEVNCIFLMLTGGPSQLDTWDMKPDAPSDIRGPFRPIRTNVPGIQISELFPLMARHADKYSLIRSVYHDGPALHETGAEILLNPNSVQLTGTDFNQARQLIERGVRHVTVNMYRSVFDDITWDSHGSKPFSSISHYRTHVGPAFDKAYSGLLEDLHQRSMLDTTLVVAAGEFGRSPKINPAGGRDHWPQCWTVLVAGGGVKGGQIYGSSDRTGSEPKDKPVHASKLDDAIRELS